MSEGVTPQEAGASPAKHKCEQFSTDPQPREGDVLTVLPLGPVFPGEPWRNKMVFSRVQCSSSELDHSAARPLSPELSPCLL